MAILVKNQSTNEVVRISGIKLQNGSIVPKKANLGQRFIENHAAVLSCINVGERQTFTLNNGYELVTGKTHQPRAEKKADEPKVTESMTVNDEPKMKAVPAKKAAKVTKKEHVGDGHTDDEDAALIIAALKRMKGGSVDADTVRGIVEDVLTEMLTKVDEPRKRALVAKVSKSDKKEVYCEKFERMVAKVSRGNHIYLHGPAGCGKSHTAEQIAERLGLDYYSQTTIQFAHDVRGYGDAGGNFQDTPFFKAFANGGLYFQDEYDRSNAEAAIVLNTALANGYYDFPIVGRVIAHPNFRFMAAGNTLMKGADEEYVSGQPQDASCRDRFAAFFKVGYSHEVELAVAHGNEEIVAFVEDVRQAVATCGLQHVVSYRATAAMIDEVEHENDKVSCCEESVFKGLEQDEIREIYGALKNKENAWARATKKLF